LLVLDLIWLFVLFGDDGCGAVIGGTTYIVILHLLSSWTSRLCRVIATTVVHSPLIFVVHVLRCCSFVRSRLVTRWFGALLMISFCSFSFIRSVRSRSRYGALLLRTDYISSVVARLFPSTTLFISISRYVIRLLVTFLDNHILFLLVHMEPRLVRVDSGCDCVCLLPYAGFTLRGSAGSGLLPLLFFTVYLRSVGHYHDLLARYVLLPRADYNTIPHWCASLRTAWFTDMSRLPYRILRRIIGSALFAYAPYRRFPERFAERARCDALTRSGQRGGTARFNGCLPVPLTLPRTRAFVYLPSPRDSIGFAEHTAITHRF